MTVPRTTHTKVSPDAMKEILKAISLSRVSQVKSIPRKERKTLQRATKYIQVKGCKLTGPGRCSLRRHVITRAAINAANDAARIADAKGNRDGQLSSAELFKAKQIAVKMFFKSIRYALTKKLISIP